MTPAQRERVVRSLRYWAGTRRPCLGGRPAIEACEKYHCDSDAAWFWATDDDLRTFMLLVACALEDER